MKKIQLKWLDEKEANLILDRRLNAGRTVYVIVKNHNLLILKLNIKQGMIIWPKEDRQETDRFIHKTEKVILASPEKIEAVLAEAKIQNLLSNNATLDL